MSERREGASELLFPEAHDEIFLRGHSFPRDIDRE